MVLINDQKTMLKIDIKVGLKIELKIDFLNKIISCHGGVENDQNRRRGSGTPIL
jgi:hypothetical protein